MGLLGMGSPWLHLGNPDTSLLGLAGGAVLTSRWTGQDWASHLSGRPLAGTPWEALAFAQSQHPGPWVGAATYELACDEAGLPRKDLLLGTLGQHWTHLHQALHLAQGQAELWSWEDQAPDPAAWSAWVQRGRGPGAALPSLDLAPRWDEATHRASVEAIKTTILDGGFYVANLCVPFEGSWAASPSELAQVAIQRARPPFGALLDLGDLHLLSLSMERLLARQGDRLWAQPIKGSVPLTGDAAQDLSAAHALAADPKERAEHTMILDLVRNDLGRVARTGSVRVSRPMEVVPYPTVQHLVSTVEAEARPGLSLPELLRAMLPGGSVTGAPKHAVCAHLAMAEAAPRGFYCGALGWLAPDGDLDFALPIRTAQIANQHLTYWTGGGITRRSEPQREWAELFLKTRALIG